MSIINEYIKTRATLTIKDYKGWQLCPIIYCKDGFNMSVQASAYHYSLPREAQADSYTSVEVGFPSEKEPLLVDFVEQSFADQHEGIEIKYTKTVYPYVPVKVVDEVIKKHGGIKEDVCVD